MGKIKQDNNKVNTNSTESYTPWSEKDLIAWYKNWLKGDISEDALETATLEQLKQWHKELTT